MRATPQRTRLGTGALVWAGFDGEHAPREIIDAVRDGRIGGILLFAIRGNVRSKEQVRAMLREIQSAAREGGLPPVPVAVDQEGGQVVRVAYRAVFPSAMAIGATGDPSLAERAGRAVAEGLRAEGVISVSFGCPYEGHVPPERVFAIAQRLVAAGAAEIGFGDTTGMANPRQVGEFFAAAAQALPGVELTAHFHNTRGQGLANVYAALEAGCTSFESSFGELGGCPVPAGATGNIATEDLVSMLHEMGVQTGVDLPALVEAARAVRDVLGRPLGSHTLIAGPVDWHDARA
jgi:hypothetical protein